MTELIIDKTISVVEQLPIASFYPFLIHSKSINFLLDINCVNLHYKQGGYPQNYYGFYLFHTEFYFLHSYFLFHQFHRVDFSFIIEFKIFSQ